MNLRELAETLAVQAGEQLRAAFHGAQLETATKSSPTDLVSEADLAAWSDLAARAIENLLYLYAERIDAGDLEGVADLFAHGRIQASPGPGEARTFAGRDAVLALYRASTRLYDDGTPRTKHVTTNAFIELEPGGVRANARSGYTVFQQAGDAPLQPIICGRYADTFHVIDGRWWFDTRVMHVDLLGDLTRHLLYALRSS